jgi:tetratricopeptide (TPR) repeat protein
MEAIEKTVFISYRRTGFAWAMAVWQNLTANGYDVFIDYEGIASGDFESAIVDNIRSRAHFVLILTPSALERCSEPGDWLRREIETALDCKRNIVPLMLEEFSFSTPAIANELTGSLAAVKKYNALRVPKDYFLEAMERLRDKFLAVPLSAVIQPPSASAKRAANKQRTAAKAAPRVHRQELWAQRCFERGYASSDPVEQIRSYSEAIRLQPDFFGAYNNRGIARGKMGDFEGALADCVEAIRLNPDFAEAYSNRGVARKAKGDFGGALADYAEAIRLKPDFADAYYGRGTARVGQGDLDGALADYTEALRLEPGYADAYSNRGFVRRAQGDLDGALADYAEAIRLKPNFAEVYNCRGIVRDTQGDLDGALGDYAEAIRLNPEYVNAYYNRGLLFRKMKQNAPAIADFQRYLTLGGGTQKGNTEKVEGLIRGLQEGRRPGLLGLLKRR